MGEATTQQLTGDIDRTRDRLSRDFDELEDKLSPGRIAERRKAAVKGRISTVRDRVMGSAEGTGSALSSAGQGVGDTATGAVQQVTQRTEGNPLAAGLIAFGAGMLLGSLLPASEAETQAAQRGIDAAKEHAEPVKEQAAAAAQEVGQNLKESGAEAASQVADTARQGTERVKQEGQSSAQQVADTAQQ